MLALVADIARSASLNEASWEALNSVQSNFALLAQVLHQIGLAVMLVGEQADILFASTAAQAMLSKQDGLTSINQQLSAVHAPDNIRLLQTIQFTAPDPAYSAFMQPKHKTIYVHRGLNERPYLLTFVQMPRLQHSEDADYGRTAMVILRDLQANYQGLLARMKRQYALTQREAEAAVLLSEGRDTKEIAELLYLSVHTVRQHLKSAYKKMRVNKQHELVCLILELSRKR